MSYSEKIIWGGDSLGPHNLDDSGRVIPPNTLRNLVNTVRSALFEEDDIEDPDFEVNLREKYQGWYFVKLVGFTTRSFEEIGPWLTENVRFGKYDQVGWESGCSYSVGVVFEHPKDAMMFKLRWR
jgi:hypothetical protein